MKKVYRKDDLKEIVTEIVDRNYDVNYASVLASDFFFGENPNIKFGEDFSVHYRPIMDYFLHAPTQEKNLDNFKRILNDIMIALKKGDIGKEDLVYILFKEEIKKLEKLYLAKKISPTIFKRQVLKFGGGDFDKLVENHFGEDS